MKSVKPGRSPSFMGGIGSLVSIACGIFWTIMSVSMGAPFFFKLFGIVFIVFCIVYSVYYFRNAAAKNRLSTYDISDDEEAPDPLDTFNNSRNERKRKHHDKNESEIGNYCPYCGSKREPDYLFCKHCGKKIK